MYKKITNITLLSFVTIALLNGCGSSSSDSGSSSGISVNDLAYSVRVDNTTGFLNLANISTQTSLDNSNGLEIVPSIGIYKYKDNIYTSGSLANDKLIKYSYENNKITKVAELSAGENSIPTAYTFINDTKAYVSLGGSAELLVINPSNMTLTKRINLSEYAMGENDNNPEVGSSIARGSKLYLSLGQIDSFQTYKCYEKASVLIIDIPTDTVLKHITDDRTCSSGSIEPRPGFILDENNDIYVNNTGSYGYYPGMNAGYLRIKNGEDDFDPDYYFSITDINDLDVVGGKANYAYLPYYAENGMLYTTLMIPGLTSSPPDYTNDRNYQPYKLDLYNQTVTKLDLPASIGWSNEAFSSNGEIFYALSTAGGTGFYKLGSTTPDIVSEGDPITPINLN